VLARSGLSIILSVCHTILSIDVLKALWRDSIMFACSKHAI